MPNKQSDVCVKANWEIGAKADGTRVHMLLNVSEDGDEVRWR